MTCIVIGSGAGVAPCAPARPERQARACLLERGGYLPRERDNWDSGEVFVKAKYRAPEFWYDKHGDEFPPGGQLLRRREHEVLRGGAVPAAAGGLRRAAAPRRDLAGLADRLRELEPYYTEAEHLYRVHGRHGEDPTEGPYGADYAHPPVEHEPRIQQLSDDMEKLGLRPFHLPIGVDLDQDVDGFASRGSACIRCDPGGRVPLPGRGEVRRTVVCVDPAVARRRGRAC
jgi:hypothetical protein